MKTHLTHIDMMEKQQMLAMYMQSVLIDFDNETELKHIIHCLQPGVANIIINEARPIMPPEA